MASSSNDSSKLDFSTLARDWGTLLQAAQNSEGYLVNKLSLEIVKVSSFVWKMARFVGVTEVPAEGTQLDRAMLNLAGRTKTLLRTQKLNPDQKRELEYLITEVFARVKDGGKEDRLFGSEQYLQLTNSILEDSNSDNPSALPVMPLIQLTLTGKDEYEGSVNLLLQPHGFGVAREADGTIYEGMWVDGKKHGYGMMTNRNGEMQAGRWGDDVNHTEMKEMFWFQHFKSYKYDAFKFDSQRANQSPDHIFYRLCKSMGQEWGINLKTKLPGGLETGTTGSFTSFGFAAVAYAFQSSAERIEKLSIEKRPVGSEVFLPHKEEIESAYINAVGNVYRSKGHFESRKLDFDILISRYQKNMPVIMATGWGGHATVLILYKGYAAYINRGDRNDLSNNSTIYKIADDPGRVAEFLRNPDTQAYITHDKGFSRDVGIKFFEETEKGSMFDQLGLEVIGNIHFADQKTGNCGKANATSSLEVLGILIKIIESPEHEFQTPDGLLDVEKAMSSVEPYYKLTTFSYRIELLRSFLRIHREQTLAGGPRLSDKDHFAFISSVLYKTLRKPTLSSQNNQILVSDTIKAVSQHFNRFDYKIEDCIVYTLRIKKTNYRVTQRFAKEMIAPLIPGSFVLHRETPNQLLITFKTSEGDIVCIPAQRDKKGYVFTLQRKTEQGTLQEETFTVSQFSDLRMLADLKYPVRPDSENKRYRQDLDSASRDSGEESGCDIEFKGADGSVYLAPVTPPITHK